MEIDGASKTFERRHQRRPVFGRAGGGGGHPLGFGRLLPQPAGRSPDPDPDRGRRGRPDHVVPAPDPDSERARAAPPRLEGLAGGHHHRGRRPVAGHDPVHRLVSAGGHIQGFCGDFRPPADPAPDRDCPRLDHPRRAEATLVLAGADRRHDRRLSSRLRPGSDSACVGAAARTRRSWPARAGRCIALGERNGARTFCARLHQLLEVRAHGEPGA